MIGSVLNVAAVAHYAVPMNLVIRSQVFAGALSRTLFPRMSSVGQDEANRLASRALLSLAHGYSAICAPAIILTPVFLVLDQPRFRMFVVRGLPAPPPSQIMIGKTVLSVDSCAHLCAATTDAHEIAHIVNGHLDFLEANRKESKTVDWLTRHAFELDADVMSWRLLYDFLRSRLKPLSSD